MSDGYRSSTDAKPRFPHRGDVSYHDSGGSGQDEDARQSAVPRVDTCRSCGDNLRFVLADLGETPLANRFLTAEQLNEPEPRFPLRIRVCRGCFLVQHDVVIAPEVLYDGYVYYSSFSETWVNHARRYVELAAERFALDERSLVIEIGSNDGYLLRHFVPRGVPVLGIEPAENLAEASKSAGVTTETRFFDETFGRELQDCGVAADLMIANNVLAHVPDINDFLKGVRQVLKPNGVFSAEFPHLLRLIENTEFDTFYHEHFFYLSLHALEPMFTRHGLRIFDVEELATHGGSLRIYAELRDSRARPDGSSLSRVRNEEIQAGLLDPATYTGFSQAIGKVRRSLKAFLTRARAERKSVVGFGAAAKGNVLLNYCGVGKDDVNFVADEIPAKIGKFLPGTRIPVVSKAHIQDEKPDYVLILPWNHKEEIMRKLSYIGNWNGAFVLAIPRVKIIRPGSDVAEYGQAS